MKFGAHVANTGEAVYNWLTASWFVLIASFVKSAFITQSKTLIELAKTTDVIFFDLHVRIWKGKLYLSNGLYLFDKTLAAAIKEIKNNAGDKQILYRVVYDDLLPASIWNWKVLRKAPIVVEEITGIITKLFSANGAGKLISISFASNPHIQYVVSGDVRVTQPPRKYHSQELDAFLEYLGGAPTGENEVVIAAPSEVWDFKSGFSIPSGKLWASEIKQWLAHNRADSKAIYAVNFV
jgi:hypothetical protein